MAAIMIHNVSVSKIENKLKLNSKRPTTRHSRTVLTDATYVIKPSSCLLVVGLGGQLFTGCWPWWSAVYWLLALVVKDYHVWMPEVHLILLVMVLQWSDIFYFPLFPYSATYLLMTLVYMRSLSYSAESQWCTLHVEQWRTVGLADCCAITNVHVAVQDVWRFQCPHADQSRCGLHLTDEISVNCIIQCKWSWHGEIVSCLHFI